ncbi:hypothetical protein DQK91_08970 [Oceanidesulfovibrio marinus]|uniref:histidine kinase n=2 Tax=Oceanidesulfovibrio marinus TaxID=370038 RepID=A0A6P1ZHQ5_9BACT|nr:hypothetical protein DQK91_08970 [Oceanidesulfovibrio marinus]
MLHPISKKIRYKKSSRILHGTRVRNPFMQPCPFDPDLSRALVVDNDRATCDSLAMQLERTGFVTQTCAQPDHLVESMNGGRYSLAFINLHLQEVGGLDLATSLLDSQSVEDVVFMGDPESSDTLVRAMQIGACDFLPTPVQEQDLGMLLERIRQRRRLKARIHRAEYRHSLLLQSIPLIVFSIRPDLTLEFINQSVTHFLGYSPEEAMARRNWLGYLIHPEDRRAIRSTLRKAFDEGSPFSVECRLIHRKGHIVHGIARSITELPCDPDDRANGAGRRVEGVFMDITDRVFLEQALVQSAKLKTLGSISAEVAHEIRNPLMSIAGFARRLNQKTPAPELDIILRESARLEELLNRIRDYLKPVNVSRQGCSVNNLLSNAAALLATEMDARSVEWRVDLDHEVPLAMADPDALTQVVIDLVRHALANLADGGYVNIQSASSERNVLVKISYLQCAPVSDPDRLFLPFEEDTDVHGMPLCSRLVRNMGGVLDFDQTLGKRSIATFTVSMSKVDTAPAPLEGSFVEDGASTVAAEELRHCFEPRSGVLSRQLFDDVFARTVRASNRAKQSLGVIVIEVDGIGVHSTHNGQFHAKKSLDHVASALARELQQLPCNILARYGDHEYVAILPDTLQDEAATLGETLRQAVHDLAIPVAGPEDSRTLEVHIGVSAFTPTSSTSPEEYIAQAYHALDTAAGREERRAPMGSGISA